MIRKVLVANRGEIAIRVIRALKEAGIGSVAVYSDADRAAPHVRMADEAAHIGPAAPSESYLEIDRILDAAKTHGADAIHPGYGFLSENAEFAEVCERSGIIFIGPRSESIRRMGSKTAARKLAMAAGIPVVPGAEGIVDVATARRAAREIGYPVMIKAAAGGGGKGMRRVDSESELESALRDAASEAERSFKSAEVYIEKLIVRPRHIEIQVLADRFGHTIHLGERECSVQRRHQKVIEECPSPLMTRNPDLRRKMGEAAVRAARAADYINAGTVEFLVDDDEYFYFLEMNTRLQVEHPVTELVTALDLVRWQLRIADGDRLSILQEDVTWRGSAIECRIYAEDPDNQFCPSPGTITGLHMPSGPGIRLDSGVFAGWTVPMEYDPLLAKLAVWAGTREEAMERMLRALDETFIAGIRSNIDFFRRIFKDEQFRLANLHTGFIEEFFAREKHPNEPGPELEMVAALVALTASRQKQSSNACVQPARSNWLSEGRSRLFR
jgi:acetyl-CoA carboxylase biotin carboxylase subunit